MHIPKIIAHEMKKSKLRMQIYPCDLVKISVAARYNNFRFHNNCKLKLCMAKSGTSVKRQTECLLTCFCEASVIQSSTEREVASCLQVLRFLSGTTQPHKSGFRFQRLKPKMVEIDVDGVPVPFYCFCPRGHT